MITPVRNRRDLLAALLHALDAQTYDDFEVIVVDDGSTDGADELAECSLVHGRPVCLLRSNGGGAVAARLVGVAASKAEVLAFTDSDCVPLPTWLEAGMRAIDAGADMVNGRTRPARPVAPLERSVSSGEEGLYPTCNMFYRRTAYDAAGGFDRDEGIRLGFRPGRRAQGLGFCEDTLLAWRVRRGHAHAYAPDAVVEHHVFPADAREWLRRSAMVGAFPTVVRAVPELRETLMSGPLLFHQTTRLPMYGVAVAVGLRRPRWALACVGAWVWLQLRDEQASSGSRRAVLRALPARFAVDAVAAASLAAGSLRARTLAL